MNNLLLQLRANIASGNIDKSLELVDKAISFNLRALSVPDVHVQECASALCGVSRPELESMVGSALCSHIVIWLLTHKQSGTCNQCQCFTDLSNHFGSHGLLCESCFQKQDSSTCSKGADSE